MLIRYASVGACATGVHYMVLIILISALQIKPHYATTIGALVGALVAYLGNKQFTFSSQGDHYVLLPRFLIVAAGGALMNGSIVWLGEKWLQWHYMILQVIATTAVLLITYFLNRSWTFYDYQ